MQTSVAPPLPGPSLLAHELRTPLNAIIGYADAMRAGVFGPVNAPYGEQAEIIHAAALHLLALIDDMARSDPAGDGVWAVRGERFDAAALAREVVAWLAPRAAGAGISIETDLGAAPSPILADPRALRQILVNLLDNALKFTGAGGRIRLGLTREGADLILRVEDSGPGDASRAPPTPRAGSGLGLRLVAALAGAHGGSMRLDTPSGAGGGATATVRLPASPGP
jgi:cell cycle sensor histidine kinase DivJ